MFFSPVSGWRWQWQWMGWLGLRTWLLLLYLIHWPNGYQENDTLLCAFQTLHVKWIKMIPRDDFQTCVDRQTSKNNDDAVYFLKSFWPQELPAPRGPTPVGESPGVAFGLTPGCTATFLVSRLFHSDLTRFPLYRLFLPFFTAIALSILL